MPLVKGLALMVGFALAWGVFAGINAGLLRVIADVPLSVLSVVPSLGLGFLESLVLLELVDRAFVRAWVALFEVRLRPDVLAWAVASPLRGPSAEPGPTQPPPEEAQPEESGPWALVLADGGDKL